MSVIVSEEGRLTIQVKGSPEKLRELCLPESLPSNFHPMLDTYAKSGYRVLACASRSLDAVT
jgi:cation-transporting ATPase 13A3/4/5